MHVVSRTIYNSLISRPGQARPGNIKLTENIKQNQPGQGQTGPHCNVQHTVLTYDEFNRFVTFFYNQIYIFGLLTRIRCWNKNSIQDVLLMLRTGIVLSRFPRLTEQFFSRDIFVLDIFVL